MPVALLPETAHRWATRRAIDRWIVILAGIPVEEHDALAAELRRITEDGGGVTLAGDPATPALAEVADRLVPDTAARDARTMATTAWLDVDDIRRAGIVAAEPGRIVAGSATGAGAVVALLAGERRPDRRLTWTEPDAMVTIEGLAALDAERWSASRAHRERVLLNPGPTVTTDRVHRAAAGPDLCHREPEYGAIARRVRSKLLMAVGAGPGWEAVLVGGGGTSAMEAMTIASVRPGRRILVVRNGTYGDRLARMAERAGIERRELSWEVTEPAQPREIADALDADPGIDAVAVVHHETTTGMLNPVAEIAAVCHERGRLLAVDAISSLGAEELDLTLPGIGLVAGTANKCLHGLPGVSFVLLSPEGIVRVREARPPTVYLDLAAYLDAASRGSVPFTPPIPAVYALEAALDELSEEGPAARRAFYRERIGVLDRELAALGLQPVVAKEARSSSIRAIRLPEGIGYETLHAELKRRGYVIYAGMGPAAAEQFRICLLGALSVEVVEALSASLGEIIRSQEVAR